jgi:demethylmenaquinone methyltransferase/2-methoxy-6-polyprenyl-1,4-benzoquinol methylase
MASAGPMHHQIDSRETVNQRETEHSKAVREMFSRIAGRYDLLNHFLSLNIDKRWRRRVRDVLSDILESKDAVVLDVACGTGDLSFELRRGAKARVMGSDFCRPMLVLAREKSIEKNVEIPFIEGDAMALPFADSSFDAVTIGFGFRNLPNFDRGMAELCRVLRRGGKLVILEFSTPAMPGFRQLFRFYFRHVLPRIGGVVSGSPEAYTYLPDSVSKFPDQRSLAELMTRSGLSNVTFQNLTGGIAAIHEGIKGS